AQAHGNAIRPPTHEDPFAMDRCLPEEEAAAAARGIAGTRLTEPTVSLVCAHRRGNAVVLSPEDARPLNLKARRDRNAEAPLLRRSVRLQNRFWVEHFRKQEAPDGWQKSPTLRHYRLAVFTDG